MTRLSLSKFLSRFRRTPSSKDLTLRQVLSASTTHRFPTLRQWRHLPNFLSRKESVLFRGAALVAGLSALTLLWLFVSSHRVDIPTSGGSYTEALVGSPQYINPLYAGSNDVDADLAHLIYSGLMRSDAKAGIVPDLASEVTISEDGLTYTLKIRDDARFHNGDEVLARDVVFTISAIQNPQYRSPLGVSFQGVEVSQVDDKTVAFQLKEPFAPFLSTLTVGILPENLWGDIDARNAPLAERNLEPIGSGPYRFAKFSKDKKGNILSYTLERNTQYYGTVPLVSELTFKFYTDAGSAVEALDSRYVEGIGFVPPELQTQVDKDRSVTVYHPAIPRETILFFNEEKRADLKKLDLRRAIALAIDKQAIINTVLAGYGTPIDAPILPGMIGYHPDVAKISRNIEEANTLLDNLGYTKVEGVAFRQTEKDSTDHPLSFTLTTVQSPEFVQAAELIRDQLAEIGIEVEIASAPQESFASTVLAPHAYELLLSGVLVGLDPDPYPFWHSSQTKNGGLNLALYANRKADTLLEDARRLTNPDERAATYRAFQDLVAADIPAVFLYQASYAYAISTRVKNVTLDRIASPADRFANIMEWYIKTKKTLR